MQIYCPNCDRRSLFNPHQYHCECGDAFEPVLEHKIQKDGIKQYICDLWRYSSLFPVEATRLPVRLGAGWTPLLPMRDDNNALSLKLEYFSPTASFKDRGTEIEFSVLRGMGIRRAVEDSSGNAGASAAAYAARAGIELKVFAPQSAPAAKIAQIKAFGASPELVEGMRQNATDACMESVRQGNCYASHAWSPAYLLGQMTFAWEIWEQLGCALPEEIIFPVGQGGLFMGTWLGFHALKEADLISGLPRLSIAQPTNFNPLVRSILEQWENWRTIPANTSRADGLAVSRPIRWRRIRQAVQESGGRAISVSEDAISTAVLELAQHGFYVEPSSAVAYAACCSVLEDSNSKKIIIPLTGSGLKGIQQ